MVQVANLALRFVELAFCAVIIGLVADLLHNQHWGGSPAVTKYALFCGVWGALIALLGIIAAFSSLLQIIVMTVLDLLATIFFLCAGIAMAVKLHIGTCSRQSDGSPSDYTTHNYIINGGSLTDALGNTIVWLGTNFPKRCREAQAITAFLWFAFAVFLVSTILDITGRKNKNKNKNKERYDDDRVNDRHDLPPPVTQRQDLPPSVQRVALVPEHLGSQRQPWV